MSHILRHCSALYRYPFTSIGRFPLVRVLSSSKSAPVATVNGYQSRPGSNGSWGRDTRGEAGRPERFPLHGKTIDGKTFLMGADVVLENAESRAKAVLRDVDEDGILYRSGLRDEDILERANDIPVQKVNLKNLVDAIGKLNAFYFVLRRRSLCRDNPYIHINFNAEKDSDSPDCDERTNNVGKEQVTTRQIAHLFGVSQRDEKCMLVEFEIPGIGPRFMDQVYCKVIGIPGPDHDYYVNTNAEDSNMQFTPNRVPVRRYVYNRSAIVLCTPTDETKCFQAEDDGTISVGEFENLEIPLPDERLFYMVSDRRSTVKLRSSKYDSYVDYYHDEADGTFVGKMSGTGVEIVFIPSPKDFPIIQ